MSSLKNLGLAVLAAAASGAVVSTTILATPNPLYAWLLGSTPAGMGSLANAISAFAIFCMIFAAGLTIFVLMHDRLPGRGSDLRLVLLLTVASFLAALLFEAGWHVSGAGGNLWASNPAGMTLEEGRLTALGWMTSARRAVVAGGISLVMGVVFARVRRLGAV